MSRRMSVLAFAMVVIAAVSALTAASAGARSSAAYKVAFIYVGPHNDHGWSQAHDAGRLYVQKTLGSKVQTTFKENVPELRNSKVVDLLQLLEWLGHRVTIHVPLADADEAMHEYGVSLEGGAPAGTYDTVVVAVAHDAYRALDAEALGALVAPGGLLADPRDVFRNVEMRPDVGRWTL